MSNSIEVCCFGGGAYDEGGGACGVCVARHMHLEGRRRFQKKKSSTLIPTEALPSIFSSPSHFLSGSSI